MSGPVHGYLVCGGRFHDFDFARLELLKLLAEDQDIRIKVGSDYRDVDAIGGSDFLVTYTCDVRPSEAEQRALRAWVEHGGRWLALHATSAAIEMVVAPDGGRPAVFDTPAVFPHLVETLGNRVVSHAPYGPFAVAISDPAHPLTEGIEPFETDDELYLCEYYGPLTPLLETMYGGTPRGYVEREWPLERRLVAYVKDLGRGSVLYLTLGHCASRWDMRPFLDDFPRVDRGSWRLPVYYELLRRGIGWASQPSRSRAG
jgi:uncharacterized protein